MYLIAGAVIFSRFISDKSDKSASLYFIEFTLNNNCTEKKALLFICAICVSDINNFELWLHHVINNPEVSPTFCILVCSLTALCNMQGAVLSKGIDINLLWNS